VLRDDGVSYGDYLDQRTEDLRSALEKMEEIMGDLP
jgi:hypothetical protein